MLRTRRPAGPLWPSRLLILRPSCHLRGISPSPPALSASPPSCLPAPSQPESEGLTAESAGKAEAATLAPASQPGPPRTCRQPVTLPRVECRDGSKLSAWPPHWIPARSPLPRGDRPAPGEEPEPQGSRSQHRGQRRRGTGQETWVSRPPLFLNNQSTVSAKDRSQTVWWAETVTDSGAGGRWGTGTGRLLVSRTVSAGHQAGARGCLADTARDPGSLSVSTGSQDGPPASPSLPAEERELLGRFR